MATPQIDAYRRHLLETVLVKRTRVRVRNEERRMWSLVARPGRVIRAGSFVGFYTGAMNTLECPPDSLYALDVGVGQPCIVPFADEEHISPFERDRHALASMNEPGEGEFANCHLAVQDFSHGEIEGVESIAHHDTAQFFRGMACFACIDIQSGEQLTWPYGSGYEAIRQQQGYVAGRPCQRVLNDEIFIKPNSQSVLDAIPRVPAHCVFPVPGHKNIKSARFKKHRRHSVDSQGEESESFSSGSEHEEAYKPGPSTSRRQRSD